MKKKRISYAVIGSGKHALSTFIPALRDSYNSELKFVTPSSSLIESSLPQRSVNEIMESSELDAIYIASPNSSHAEYVSYALRMGKHVLCEKPLAYKTSDIDKIGPYLKGTTLFSTGFMYRLHPQFELIRALLDGLRIEAIEACFQYSLEEGSNNIRKNRELGGGALLDVGCYLLDVVRFLFPERIIEYEISATIEKASQVDSNFEIIGRLMFSDNIAQINLKGSQNSERNQYLVIKTELHKIRVESPFLVPRNKKVSIYVTDRKGSEKKIILPAFNHHTAQINLFSESILMGQLLAPLSTGLVNSIDLSSLWSDIYVGSKIDSDS